MILIFFPYIPFVLDAGYLTVCSFFFLFVYTFRSCDNDYVIRCIYVVFFWDKIPNKIDLVCYCLVLDAEKRVLFA